MPRKIIAFEGRVMIPGQLIESGSLTWGDERIPVTRYARTGDISDLLGYATELRREDDGSITAEVDAGEYTVLLEKDVAVTITIKPAVWEEVDGVKHVTAGKIVEVFMTPDVPWVGKKPGDEVDSWEK